MLRLQGRWLLTLKDDALGCCVGEVQCPPMLCQLFSIVHYLMKFLYVFNVFLMLISVQSFY